MPNYKVTEYDTVVSKFRVKGANNKQDAIDKIANGDLIKRAMLRSNGRYKKNEFKKKYRAEEVQSGKGADRGNGPGSIRFG